MYHAAKLKFTYSSHIGFACAIVVLLGAYLFFAQSIARGHFSLESFESRIVQLQGENAALEVVILEEQSLANLKIESSKLQLEEVRDISYIQPKSGSPLVLRN